MTTKDLQSDIDYMKSLAVDGARGPLRNGASLWWAGVVYAAASCIQYGFVTHMIPLPNPWFMALNWVLASVVFAVLAVMTAPRRTGKASDIACVAYSAWSAVGLSIGSFIALLIVMSNILQQMEALAFVIAPFVLIVYGIGWWVSAAASPQGWMRFVALGCFIAAPLLGFLTGKPEQLLAYAVCLVTFAAIPGLLLMRAEKA